MKPVFLMVCSVLLVGDTVWAQTPAPPPGYRQETIQVLVPDTPAITAPTPNLPASPGQTPSATASAVGPGSNAYASTDLNFYLPFRGWAEAQGLPQGLVWQPSYPTQLPRVRVQDHWIHQRLTTTVYPPSTAAPMLLPQPRIRCRGNLFGMCPCGYHRRGVGISGGVHANVGVYY